MGKTLDFAVYALIGLLAIPVILALAPLLVPAAAGYMLVEFYEVYQDEKG